MSPIQLLAALCVVECVLVGGVLLPQKVRPGRAKAKTDSKTSPASNKFPMGKKFVIVLRGQSFRYRNDTMNKARLACQDFAIDTQLSCSQSLVDKVIKPLEKHGNQVQILITDSIEQPTQAVNLLKGPKKKSKKTNSKDSKDSKKRNSTCPSGYVQLGNIGDDVPGWGLAAANNGAANVTDCASQCNDRSDCGAFEWNADKRKCGLNSWADSVTSAQTASWPKSLTCRKTDESGKPSKSFLKKIFGLSLLELQKENWWVKRVRHKVDHVAKKNSEWGGPLPTKPGCYVYMPSGCEKRRFHAKVWTLDPNRQLGAKSNFTACTLRREQYNKWCDKVDSQIHWVPSKRERDARPLQYLSAPVEALKSKRGKKTKDARKVQVPELSKFAPKVKNLHSVRSPALALDDASLAPPGACHLTPLIEQTFNTNSSYTRVAGTKYMESAGQPWNMKNAVNFLKDMYGGVEGVQKEFDYVMVIRHDLRWVEDASEWEVSFDKFNFFSRCEIPAARSVGGDNCVWDTVHLMPSSMFGIFDKTLGADKCFEEYDLEGHNRFVGHGHGCFEPMRDALQKASADIDIGFLTEKRHRVRGTTGVVDLVLPIERGGRTFGVLRS